MELRTPKEVWLNPMDRINYKNYEEGLIKSFRLGFQDEDWYKKNKDNFSNSLKNNFPDLLPNFAKNQEYLPNNYLGFYPDEFIRYGKLEQVDVIINNNIAKFWVVKIPKGLQIYHSSRSLGLNHSEFPIRFYDDRKSEKQNLTNVFSSCPSSDFVGHNKSDVIDNKICTYVSYYSSPYVTQKYLRKDGGFGGEQIKYAYGIENKSNNTKINDRVRIQADNQLYGVQAYKLMKDTYFVILGLDDFLIDRPDLGRDNMRTFKRSMNFLSNTIKRDMKISDSGMNNFLNIINSVTGIGSLKDNTDLITRDYNVDYFAKGVRKWLEKSAKIYNNPKTKTNTAGYIKNVAYGINNNITDFSKYKGLRFSTFQHDRPVMNMLGWLFNNYEVVSKNKKIKIEGFVSSSMFVYSKGKSEIKSKPFTRGQFKYYIPDGVFHSEIGMFYAPDILERDKDNKFDLDYSINHEGIAQELRKYKTTNIMHYENGKNVKGFHQGHLLEHSMWVGIISSNLYIDKPFSEYKSTEVGSKDTYLIAGYLHDIGKSGDCTEEAVYKGLDHQDARMSVCSFVKENNDIIGMKYFDIPDHPEKGYEYLKGYKVYKKFTLLGTDSVKSYKNNTLDVYLQDWEDMFDTLDMDSYNKRLIRIAVGAHWYFGDTIKKLVETGGDDNDVITNLIRKIEMFFNDEFFSLDKDLLYSVIIFVIVVSVADILGSEYNPKLSSASLSSDQRATLINYLPNISQNKLDFSDPKPIADQIISYALEVQKNSTFKKNLFKDVRENTEGVIQTIINTLENFKFKQGNNYSVLYNLTENYLNISDIKRAYGDKFPKVIAFDLDQTMFAIKFNPRKQSTYYIYEDTYKIMEDVQKLRKEYFPKHPTYIAVTSRHYSPKSLQRLLVSKTHNGKPNPLYYTNFDFIIARYTGPKSKIQNDMSGVPGFFKNNGIPSDGFIMDVDKDVVRNIPDKSESFPDLDKISKHGHFYSIKKKYDVEYSDILSFDDDEKYFTSKGLGPASDVFVAGVLKSRNKEKQGIRVPLFRKGIALFVFDKIKN